MRITGANIMTSEAVGQRSLSTYGKAMASGGAVAYCALAWSLSDGRRGVSRSWHRRIRWRQNCDNHKAGVG